MPDLVYLHGFCSGPDSFKGSYFRDRLGEKGLRLHTPDLNCPNFEHLTISAQLEHVEQIVAGLNGPVILMGSSMGAFLASLIAERSSKISHLLLIAPAFQFTTRYAEKLPKEDLQRWRELGYIDIYHHAYREPRKLHFGILADAKKYDDAVLKRRIPALVIHGLQDETVPWQLSKSYLRSNPTAKLLLLNGDHQLKEQVEIIWQQSWAFIEAALV